jgi:hypothetical protein
MGAQTQVRIYIENDAEIAVVRRNQWIALEVDRFTDMFIEPARARELGYALIAQADQLDPVDTEQVAATLALATGNGVPA